jgi:glucan phosphoethanolaminetransferase (alkaline phosphatase superfamily)
MKKVKTITAYILIALVLVFTLISLLGVWDIISMDDIVKKIISSLLIIFVASAVALFIFSMFLKNQEQNKEQIDK